MMGASMDIRNIETFLRVVELGGFTKAANEMNYAQSTVTMQIQQIEQELGFPLFDRIGKKISLTSAGREFLSYANEISHIMEQINTLGKQPNEVSGILRVGILESLLFGVMLDILPVYKRQYANIDIQIKMGQAADLLMLLKQNQLDMIYVSGNLNTDCDIYCCYRRQENLVFVASPSHVLANRLSVPLSEFLMYPLIVTECSGVCYGRLKELASAYNLILRHAFVVDSTVAISELLCRDMGLSFLPEYSISRYLNEKDLVKVNVDVPPQIYYSQILYHKSKWIPPFMEGLISLIQKVRPEIY